MELVVGASEATMKSLLSKLGGLLAQEYALIRGIRGDIQFINDELASMHAFLTNLSATGAGDYDDHDPQTKDWMKQVRDIAYDMEDCIDDFAHRLRHGPRGDGGCLAEMYRAVYEICTFVPRRDIAAKVAELKSRAQHVGERRARYGVLNPRCRPRRRTGAADAAAGAGQPAAHLLAAENQVAGRRLVAVKDPVGMAAAIDRLKVWLTSGRNSSRGVLAIVGFGGVGKTTIAAALYRNHGHKFDCRAWVTVSQKFDIRAVLKNMLSQVMLPAAGGDGRRGRGNSRPEIETMPQDQLKKELEHHLENKRYVLIVDDVWSAAAWETIRNHLPSDKASSRVVVTTRFHAVAGSCIRDRTKDLLHQVNHLSSDHSKSLFEESVSASRDSRDYRQALTSPPDRILELCKGLPLAIVTIAGLVACKQQTFDNQWSDICRSLRPDLVNCHTPEGVTRILNYCYNSLPADLKTCSLYLSVFPKASRISRKRLTRRWIAEGFISEKHGQSVEELADTYFNQLIRRNIMKPVDHGSDGKVKTCQVHDMILEYIISKSSEENFITVVGGHWLMPTPSNKVRRLSIHSSDLKHAKETLDRMNLSHVRSVTVFGSLNQLPFISLKLAIVQVLDLEGCKGFKKHHVKDIFKMLLLKYLNLRGTDINTIPSKIGKLRYLETLDIRDTDVQKLPDTIVLLERLTTILGGNTATQIALKLPEETKKKPMKSLHILSGIEISEEPTSVRDFHEFIALRKLGIQRLKIQASHSDFETLLSSIEYLGGCSLQNLSINDECSDFIDSLDSLTTPPKYLHSLELCGMFIKVPRWVAGLMDLKNLTLSVTALRTDTLELIQQLPLLFCLIFSSCTSSKDLDLVDILEKNKSESEGQILVKDGGFESLKLLRLDAPLLPLLVFSERAMRNLERLDLKFNTLDGIFGMGNLPSLREVHMTAGEKAGGITKSIVRKIVRKLEAEAGANKPTVVVYGLAVDRSKTHTPIDSETE